MERARIFTALTATLAMLTPLAFVSPAAAAAPAAAPAPSHADEPEIDVHIRGVDDLGDGTVLIHQMVSIGEEPPPPELSTDEAALLDEVTQASVSGPGYVRNTGSERVTDALRFRFDDSWTSGMVADAGVAEASIEQLTGTTISAGAPPACTETPAAAVSCGTTQPMGDVAMYVHPISPCGAPGPGFTILGCASTRRITTGPDAGTTVGGLVVTDPSVPDSSLQRQVVIHELAHIIGLSHFDAPYRGVSQVMASVAGGPKAGYEAGDTNGLISLATGGGSRSPIGAMAATGGAGSVVVSGWAFDRDGADVPVTVQVRVDGALAGSTQSNPAPPFMAAGQPQPGAFPYAVEVPAAAGTRQICATALNAAGPGSSSPLGCTTAAVTPGGNPFGNLESAGPAPGGIRANGWTLDPDTTGPVTIHAYVDGGWGGVYTADTNRPDVGAAYPGYGTNHGYTITIPTSAGTHTVCLYAINQGTGTTNPLLGCRTTRV
jgi:hypothetical protein